MTQNLSIAVFTDSFLPGGGVLRLPLTNFAKH